MSVDDRVGVWVEKYRPQTIEECILPKGMKDNFKQFIEKGEFPNLLLLGGAGVGKCLDVETNIPTPDGVVKLKDIRNGDTVYGLNGSQVEVLEAYEIHSNNTCYEVEFDTGDIIKTDADHIWTVSKSTRTGYDAVNITTKEMVNSGVLNNIGRSNYKIPLCNPIINSKQQLLIDPYLLGMWLGDGSTSSNKIHGHVDNTNFIINKIESAGYEVGSIGNECSENGVYVSVLDFCCDLKELGVFGNKHIPDIYMNSSYDDRLNLLKGLLDTDGYISKTGKVQFTQKSSSPISNQVYRLLAGLGIKASIVLKPYVGDMADCGDGSYYSVYFSVIEGFNPFTLGYKMDIANDWINRDRSTTTNDIRYRFRYIKSIKEIESIPVRCIKVDSPDHLFLCGDSYIPTHNTTVAKALCNELGFTNLVVNASENGNIDTLRVTIRNFASSRSLNGKKKVVILDEADYLNAQSTQPALRNFMESFHKNVIFILTANFENRIIDPLKSRCSTIRFGNYTKSESMEIKKVFFCRIKEILKLEGIESQDTAIASILKRFYPDFRKTLNEMQRLSYTGSIENGSVVTLEAGAYESLFKAIKAKDFKMIRGWVSNNTDLEPNIVMRKLYENSTEFLDINSLPQMILTINKYDYQNAFVSDKEVNLAAMFLEILLECDMS